MVTSDSDHCTQEQFYKPSLLSPDLRQHTELPSNQTHKNSINMDAHAAPLTSISHLLHLIETNQLHTHAQLSILQAHCSIS